MPRRALSWLLLLGSPLPSAPRFPCRGRGGRGRWCGGRFERRRRREGEMMRRQRPGSEGPVSAGAGRAGQAGTLRCCGVGWRAVLGGRRCPVAGGSWGGRCAVSELGGAVVAAGCPHTVAGWGGATSPLKGPAALKGPSALKGPAALRRKFFHSYFCYFCLFCDCITCVILEILEISYIEYI